MLTNKKGVIIIIYIYINSSLLNKGLYAFEKLLILTETVLSFLLLVKFFTLFIHYSSMPQLDKISFATQYFWLTLFFFGLYFLSVNFFVILVFKNLKLRSIIYKIWYFFLYKFDYADYNNKHKNLINSSFNFTYYVLYINFFISTKIGFMLERIVGLVNKTQTLDQSKNSLIVNSLNGFLNSNVINLSRKFQELNIDEI